ncbi:MAG: hypothetical protein R2932_18175 [Caldilineaceae bacterium]
MSNIELNTFLGHWLPLIESEMREHLRNPDPVVAQHYGMLQYHMGGPMKRCDHKITRPANGCDLSFAFWPVQKLAVIPGTGPTGRSGHRIAAQLFTDSRRYRRWR